MKRTTYPSTGSNTSVSRTCPTPFSVFVPRFATSVTSFVPRGRFVVLHVGAAKTAVLDATGKTLRIDNLPFKDDPSHAGILGYSSDDLMVALELKALVRDRDVYHAV